jgi:hypothetical protein
MSKRENHSHLFGMTIEALAKSMAPRGLWLVLIAMFAIGFHTGALQRIVRNAKSPGFVPLVTVLLTGIALGAGVLWGRWRQASARSNCVKALQHPTPEKLIEVVAASMNNARALPDADAVGAQSRAIAYALYGRADDATRALAGVDWTSKAPLIQAIGLSAEGLIELLCRRHVKRALELHRMALAMSSINAALPGAAQSERYHRTCLAVSEVLLNAESPTSLRWLEESEANARFPPLQLLASFGLMIVMHRSGNTERAGRLREFIHKVAPCCAPLHLNADAFPVSGHDFAEVRHGPVSASLSLTDATGGAAVQGRWAKRNFVRGALIIVGLWALLIVMFIAIQAFVTSPR